MHVFRTSLVAASVTLLAGSAFGQVTIVDIQHTSSVAGTNTGVWNDSNSANWGIWVGPGSDPTAITAADILNAGPTGNPIGNTNISLANGQSSYVFFKENCCADSDASTKLILRQGGVSTALELTPSAVPYQSTNVAPAANGVTVNLDASRTVTVNNFNWYLNNVYNKDLVSSGQNFSPSGQADHVARLTLTSDLHAVAHYTFDNANDLAHDSSVNALHGTNSGGAGGAAHIGTGALALGGGQGNGAYVVSGDVGPIVQNGAFSVSVWFKNTGTGGVILDELGSTTPNVGWHDSQMELQTDGTLKMSVWARGGTLTSPVLDSGWHNAILSYNTAAGELTGYVDGQSIGTTAFGRQTPFGGAQGHAFYAFGPSDSTQFGNGVPFSGLIDDAQIFGTSLTAAEVQTIYSAAPVPEPGSMMVLAMAAVPLLARRRTGRATA